MLEAIRKRSASILVKILFVLLIISFGAWGIGDVLRGRATATVVASVGDADVTPEQFEQEYTREMRNQQRLRGPDFGREQARAMGITNEILGRLIRDTLLSQEAKSLGMVVGDAAVRKAIQTNRSFFNSAGKFDPDVFQQVLQSNGFNEPMFVRRYREEIKSNQILDSLTDADLAPKALTDVLYRYGNEQRVAKTIVLRDALVKGIEVPEESVLIQFHQDHAAQFTAPETRAATFVVINADDLAKEIAIDDETLRSLYEERSSDFNLPERRTLEHILLPDEEKAKEALKRLKKGDDFATVAKDEADMEGDALEIGEVTKEQLLPEMADAAFGTAEGGYSQPVKSPLGWHILRVVKISPASQQSFEDVKEILLAQAAKEKAIDSLFDMANRLEDQLGGGSTIEEAAQRLNLPLRKVPAVTRNGLDDKGQKVSDLPPGNAFLKTVFETGEGNDTTLTEAGPEAYFVARVDKIVPPALRPLAEVKQAVIDAWMAEQRRLKNEKSAEELAKRVEGGETLDDVAKSAGLEVATTEPFKRIARLEHLPQTVVRALFKAKVGGVAHGRYAEGAVVAVLTEVKSVLPSAEKENVGKLEATLSEALRSDILTAYMQSLREDYPVTVNTKVLDQF